MIIDCGAGLVVRQAVFLQPPFVSNPHDKVEPGQQVPGQWTAVPGMSAALEIDVHGLLEICGHVGMQIEGNPANPDDRPDPDDKFMLGVALQLDGQLVRDPMGTQATANVMRDWHYYDGVFCWAVQVDPGAHLVEVMARAQPKRGAGDDSLAYYKECQYSGALIKVLGKAAA